MKPKRFREYNLDQQMLLPPDVRSWLPEHLNRSSKEVELLT